MISWEEAVTWLCQQDGQGALVRACYYDNPLLGAAERYHESEEWGELSAWLPTKPGKVLDLGAGRGISSFAFAKDGWSVTALEPDPSDFVGAGAIRSLVEEGGIPIEIVEEWGESLPFPDAHFDAVYGRAVFHHANDLDDFCRETYRVLKPGGRLILTREHVLSKEEDLQAFLDSHPLHHLYGGEAAYTLERYLGALKSAGFDRIETTGTLSSAVNFFPETREEVEARLEKSLRERRKKKIGPLARVFPISKGALAGEAIRLEGEANDPGRLYSFVCER